MKNLKGKGAPSFSLVTHLPIHTSLPDIQQWHILIAEWSGDNIILLIWITAESLLFPAITVDLPQITIKLIYVNSVIVLLLDPPKCSPNNWAYCWKRFQRYILIRLEKIYSIGKMRNPTDIIGANSATFLTQVILLNSMQLFVWMKPQLPHIYNVHICATAICTQPQMDSAWVVPWGRSSYEWPWISWWLAL